MLEARAPIGVFDSGVGGLTVVREIIRQMPKERIVYFGDTARLPYGSKSGETILRYSGQIVRFLLQKQVKAIVIACNTASAYALEDLARECPVPIIGVIHAGAKTASESTLNRRVGIIGTSATVSSEIYVKMIREMNEEIEVIQKACPLLCPLVEEGLLHDNVTDEIVSRYVSELKARYIDTLVLGCTHYPLLRSTIQRIMGKDVRLVNPACETAAELRELLAARRLLNEEPAQEDKYAFYVSDMADRFRDFASFILPDEVKRTQIVNIEEF